MTYSRAPLPLFSFVDREGATAEDSLLMSPRALFTSMKRGLASHPLRGRSGPPGLELVVAVAVILALIPPFLTAHQWIAPEGLPGGGSPVGYAGVPIQLTKPLCGGPVALSISATPINGSAPLPVYFNSTTSGGCPPYNIHWEFGDGAEGSGTTANHTYFSAGVFHAWARASDTLHTNASAQTTVTVTGGSGGLQVRVQVLPSQGQAPLGVTCWANVTGENESGTPHIHWSFGDGGNGTGSPVQHVYLYVGNYTASATVWRDDGSPLTGSAKVVVTPSSIRPPPSLSLLATPSQVTAPSNVTIVARSNGPGGPYNLMLCFGDGSNCGVGPAGWDGSHAVVFVHTYLSAGAFTIDGSLNAANGSFLVRASTSVQVVAGPPLSLDGWLSPSKGVAPFISTFVVVVLGGTPPYSVQWNFGDGTYGSSIPGDSLSHTYVAAGVYPVRVVVHDASNTSAQFTPGTVSVSRVGTTGVSNPVIANSSVYLLAFLLLAAVGVGVIIGRWSVRRASVRRLRQEGEDLVREMERQR
jgi:PKD repeat protein